MRRTKGMEAVQSLPTRNSRAWVLDLSFGFTFDAFIPQLSHPGRRLQEKNKKIKIFKSPERPYKQ